MFAAATAKLAEFKTLGRSLLVFRRRVVPTLALTTLKHNIIARHNLPLKSVLCSWFFVLCLLSLVSSSFASEFNYQEPSTKNQVRFTE